MDIEKIIEGLHPLEHKFLNAFKEADALLDEELIKKTGLDEPRLDMASGWLAAKGVITVEEIEKKEFASLTELGKKYASIKIPEIRIADALKKGERFTIKDLQQRSDMEPTEISSAIGALKEAGIISIIEGGYLSLIKDDTAEFDRLQNIIEGLEKKGEVDLKGEEGEIKDVIALHHRKRGKAKGIFRIQEKATRRFSLTEEGRKLLKALSEKAAPSEEISQLTPAMLKDGSWKEKAFRKYNISLRPPRRDTGRKHPYREFLDFTKYKLVSMGFEEMRGPLVEAEFWNNDALYMPQFHPARDIHDGYFLKEPHHAKKIDEPFLRNVKAAHQNGGKAKSRGWRYLFSEERARQLVLRSQGTSVSARRLAGKPNIPGKYFSIARCFRYEQVDATHATDFFQIEGIVLGEGINFRTLLGLLKLFAHEVAGAEESKFLPAYFPFTEPSVELHVKHPKLGWMELGGAGLFRPEVTIPLGVDVPVIAWGLGLDRMAMVALGLHDIRDLFSGDLDLIRTLKLE